MRPVHHTPGGLDNTRSHQVGVGGKLCGAIRVENIRGTKGFVIRGGAARKFLIWSHERLEYEGRREKEGCQDYDRASSLENYAQFYSLHSGWDGKC